MPRLLTEAQLRQFRDEGWTAPFRAMSTEAAHECRRRIETYETSAGHDANATLKIKGHLAYPWLVELGRNPAVLDAVEDIIGPDILLFGASIFAKGAHDPRYVSWHQDSAYFGLSPHQEVTAWIAFTASRPESGCLRVLPRSHLGPDMQHVETHAKDNMLARGQTIQDLDDSGAVELVLQAGEFSLHHERTAHSSLANRSNDRRIGFAFFYIPTHVRSTLGRRTALLVRGEDRHHHWDPEIVPRFDLDPDAFALLRSVWGQYKDGEVMQAAEAVE
jgi:ectoine hydroxylase-related dioxygenase (phytanoyl-CoA dioxygenase family)